MERAVTYITLDVQKIDSGQLIKAKRGDSARRLVVSLTNRGRPYIPGEGATAVFYERKPDGNPCFNACDIDGCTVTYDFTGQTTNVEGLAACEIRLYDAGGQLLTSPRFEMLVDATEYQEGDVPDSSPEYTALTEMVAKGTELIADLENVKDGLEPIRDAAIEAAEKAATSATEAKEAAGRAESARNQANKYAYEANLSAVDAAGSAGDARAQAEAAGNSAQSAQEAAQEAGVLENSTSRYANDAYNFAVEAKKAAEEAAAAGGATTGEDAPSSATEGRVGSLYLQTGITPNCLWVCIGADDGVYRWQHCNEYAGLDLSDGGDGGVLLVPEGTETQPVLNLYGRNADENVTLRGVAPAQGDTDAPNLRQVQGLVDGHETNLAAHPYFHEQINALRDRLNALANSDDTTLDQMAEIVAYIKSNKSLIDGLSTGKLDVSALPEAIETALAQAKATGEFDGEDGEDGITPHIGGNGNWFTGSTDTGVQATGPQGEAGVSGVYTLGEGESLEDAPADADVVIDPGGAPTMETWVFTLEDGTTVEKQVYVYAV